MAEFGLFDKIKTSILEKTKVKTCKEMCGNRVDLLCRCRTNGRKSYKISDE